MSEIEYEPRVLVEHARWLRLACCTGLVASGFGLTCKVAKTCMLYWFGCLAGVIVRCKVGEALQIVVL